MHIAAFKFYQQQANLINKDFQINSVITIENKFLFRPRLSLLGALQDIQTKIAATEEDAEKNRLADVGKNSIISENFGNT